MSTDSNLILCNLRQQFLRQISSQHKETPHPLQHSNKTSNSKIFTPTKTKFWKRSLILTLPLQLALPKRCRDAVQLPFHHLSIMIKRSLVLTLPLLIS